MDQRTCNHCGLDISDRRPDAKYCSSKCKTYWTWAHETRDCSTEDCTKKVRAAGLCSTHYNQTRPGRHRKRWVQCVVCRTEVLRRVDNSRLGAHCCSPTCRAIRQWGEMAATGTYDWNADAKRRARNYGTAIIEDVDRTEVMERDSWLCYLCGIDTSGIEDPFDPRSATVDHVISLSNGGSHTMGNVRCCCLHCNASKANRDSVSAPA